jgi:Putative peptidoglycan binding domain
MKRITSLLIGCSLVLAGAVSAQQPETQESPAAKKKGAAATEKATPAAHRPEMKGKPPTAGETRGKPGAAETKAPQTAATPRGPGKHEHPAGAKMEKPGAPTSASPATAASASPIGKQAEHGKKGAKARGEAAAKAPASPAPAAGAATSPASAAGATTTTATGGTAGAAGTNATMTKEQGTVGRGGKKVETAQVQQIKQQHATFKAQPRPDKAAAVTFNANYRITAAQSWQGPQYEVFRTYHPEWHDQVWYRSHFGRVELIGGGWYFFNNGYWYPAWGYDSAAAYYPYDGPIYVGHRAEPPDRVIADVQTELQQMGYYQGEVDGLVGPLTRQALRDYQADHGLTVTEAIDEPTLDALQLS